MKDKKKEPTKEAQEPELQAEVETAELDSQIGELQKVIDTLTQQKDEMVQLAQRVQADFDNYRRRNQSVRKDALDEGRGEALLSMLPVVDNFERALEGANLEDPFAQGVQNIYKQFIAALETQGVTKMETAGTDFDPNLHNAVMQEPTEKDEENGKVAEVFQEGYRIGEKVLRHSMVKVYIKN
ncbi:nucleotide exchange factor GrpE [Gehongia tenuis]|uniref:Protein GrpE n=1 Tax=Gehongia tenuis TaxID=2763655 RepID=A0A926D362_9FIRM|nr:nucleotide exchange factor GrpE [Gehongia tenuis]MBC8530903.1 nucleotide exchange factor GrpE [Gehongia tenuis]